MTCKMSVRHNGDGGAPASLQGRIWAGSKFFQNLHSFLFAAYSLLFHSLPRYSMPCTQLKTARTTALAPQTPRAWYPNSTPAPRSLGRTAHVSRAQTPQMAPNPWPRFQRLVKAQCSVLDTDVHATV